MEILKVKLDINFKKVFADENNKAPLISLLSAFLNIREDDIHSVEFAQNEITPDFFDGKLSRLDLKVNVDGRLVNIEMQICPYEDYASRALYYWSKMFASSLKKGESYDKLPQTISINIINFKMFLWEDVQSSFEIIDAKHNFMLTDKFKMVFFELPKLKNKEIDLNNKLERWLRFINAETEEELTMLENLNDKSLNSAIQVVRVMSADENARYAAEMREKAENDYYAGMADAKAKGIAEGEANIINKLKDMGVSEDIISALENGKFNNG